MNWILCGSYKYSSMGDYTINGPTCESVLVGPYKWRQAKGIGPLRSLKPLTTALTSGASTYRTRCSNMRVDTTRRRCCYSCVARQLDVEENVIDYFFLHLCMITLDRASPTTPPLVMCF
jgi:hypothetical protein